MPLSFRFSIQNMLILVLTKFFIYLLWAEVSVILYLCTTSYLDCDYTTICRSHPYKKSATFTVTDFLFIHFSAVNHHTHLDSGFAISMHLRTFPQYHRQLPILVPCGQAMHLHNFLQYLPLSLAELRKESVSL